MKDMPLTVRRSIELLGLCLLGALLVLGQGIIMPVLMAFFVSIMLLPVYRFLRRKKVPEVLAILLPILLVAIFIAGIIWFFSSQISRLVADFPSIQKNVSIHLSSLSDWINQKTNFSTQEQVKFLKDQSNKMFTNAGAMASGAAVSLSSVFVFFGLMPIYIYLFLFYKNLLLRFVFIWFEPSQHKKVEEVMKETEVIIKSYLIGLVIQIAYITVLLGGILMLIGIKHALLIGVIFAILNLIPYVGALVGNLIGVLLTLTSSQEIGPIFIVLGVIALVQFLDNNILMPRIVGSKVRINAFAAILGVFIGGSLAGVSGMFLALPMIAVLKIIFDRADMFKQWGVLLGDERPQKSPMSFLRLRRKSDKVTQEIQAKDDIKPTKAKK
ncbi:AI-2E family transporter [Daejeonella lutea]|uniref:Predicted PurR-regulated permease PerM n=1 Tax=Daejeonella lutea TaxID=572036 RepID=A0A1T5AGD7_9SPHI|nr:AI-2E family transporter [Daejeonella lutea]SKB33817.1 Predicted PurR-regulated permease PerM [Daejeonella lutea]